nr:MAG TPA: hypothetical protein [Caudoviricetes sp.]
MVTVAVTVENLVFMQWLRLITVKSYFLII